MIYALKRWLRRFLGTEAILVYHFWRGWLAATLAGYPARQLICIGVTGTKGKTTTSHLIAAILKQAGYKVGLLSTVSFDLGEGEQPNQTNMGTLPPWQLQRQLKAMVVNGCQYAVIEVTSHSLVQSRVYGIDFAVSVMTNLSHEHLDYHKTLEAYKQAKGRLFANRPKLAVINQDDKTAPYFNSFPAGRHLGYGRENQAEIRPKQVKFLATGRGTSFVLVTPVGEQAIQTTLPGEFNLYNILAASAVGVGLGVPLPTIAAAVQGLAGVKGRMELIEAGQPFTVIVDYAHTPDSFEKLYQALAEQRQASASRIIHVFGLTGDRDRAKRPIMGAIAGRYADLVILTDDEPYYEDPAQILAEIAAGVPRGGTRAKPMVKDQNFFIIPDRRQAIAQALRLAKANDIVLVTGMGALTSRVIKGKHLPWIEQEVIREELAKL